MTLTERIHDLCNKKGITIAALERTLNLGNSTIRRWTTTSPSIDKLILVADYFRVSVDYLIASPFTPTVQTDIAKDLETIIYDLEAQKESPLFYGHDMDQIDKELLILTVKNAIQLLKIHKGL